MKYFDDAGPPKEVARKVRRALWNELVEQVASGGTLDPKKANRRREQLQRVVDREEAKIKRIEEQIDDPWFKRLAEKKDQQETVRQKNLAIYRRERARYRLHLLDEIEGRASPIEAISEPADPFGRKGWHYCTSIVEVYYLYTELGKSVSEMGDLETAIERYMDENARTVIRGVTRVFQRANRTYEDGNPVDFVETANELVEKWKERI